MASVIFDICLLAILIVIVAISAKKGLLKTAFSFVQLILSVVIAYLFGKPIASLLDQLFFRKWIYTGVFNRINHLYQSAQETFNVQKIIDLFPKFLIPQSLQEELESAGDTGEALVSSSSEAISSALSGIITTILAYLVLFLVAFVACFFLLKLLDKMIESVSLLGTVDHLLGALIGLIIAWIFLTLLCSLFRFFASDTEFYANTYVTRFFAENVFTKLIRLFDFNDLLSKVFPQ